MNFATLLLDGHRILPQLLSDFDRARSTIHVSFFLFFHDLIGIEIADALVAARRRGVAVRVLLNVEKTELGDPFSTGERGMAKHVPEVTWNPLDVRPLCARMKRDGIEVIDTNIDYDKKIQGHSPRLASHALQIAAAIDVDELHADHRKIVVIDGAVAYCGGANVGMQYLYHRPWDEDREEIARFRWHDSLTRFEGPVAERLDEVFRDRWLLDGGSPFEPRVVPWTHRQEGFPVLAATVLTNEPSDEPNEIRDTYVRLIRDATRSIFIENPYLYHPAIVDALVEAKTSRPDLRVDLVLPAREWNDNAFAHDAQQYHYRRYVDAGIDVREYQGHFNHLKLAVFDERWSIHGSTNLNFRSLEDDKDFECVVLVDDAPFAKHLLETVRDVDQARAKRFGNEEIRRTLAGRLRIQVRDPRTLLLVSRRML